ncbi:MAG: hypothetical protein ACIAS6_06395 [Phycisphaerales bacterium JB060]
MKATLDGQEISIDRPTLAAALEAGVASARAQGRIVIDVSMDGQPVDGELLSQPTDEPLDAGVLEMTSTDPLSLVRVTFFDAADAMDSAKEEHQACAEQIHRGEIGQAMAGLGQLLSTWQAVRQAVAQGGAALGQPLSAYASNGALDERTEALAKHLDDLKRAVGNDDLTTVADLLEEDLRAEAGQWADTLRHIAQAMKDS